MCFREIENTECLFGKYTCPSGQCFGDTRKFSEKNQSCNPLISKIADLSGFT